MEVTKPGGNHMMSPESYGSTPRRTPTLWGIHLPFNRLF
eukprot:SAG22_NODE_3658_length_1590_cov_1.552649_2_plen_38_part_01